MSPTPTRSMARTHARREPRQRPTAATKRSSERMTNPAGASSEMRQQRLRAGGHRRIDAQLQQHQGGVHDRKMAMTAIPRGRARRGLGPAVMAA